VLNLLLAIASQDKDADNLGDGKAALPAFSVIEVEDWANALALWNAEGRPLLSELSGRACPACGASASHTVFQSYDGYFFSECEQCGTWYAPLNIDWTLFEKFFVKCPSAREVAKNATIERNEQTEQSDALRFENYFRGILDFLPAPTCSLRYLDIGCSVGHSLSAASTLGMVAHGIEVDPDALALAKGNHEVVVRNLGDLPTGKYDVISMWETLEHLADPLGTLREAVDRLSSDGLIVITVPNQDATGLRVAREKCSYVYGGFNSPGHINFFNRRTIEILFKRAGLTLIELSYEFSTNALELFGYLGGEFAVDRPFAMSAPPPPVADALNLIWPAITLLEDFVGTLPIMHCTACRSEDISRFSSKCAERSSNRTKRLIESTNFQLKELNHPRHQLRAIIERSASVNGHFQAEIDRRDALLREAHDYLQGEISRRDALLRETHDHLQAEVNKRDQMLAELQKQLHQALAKGDQ
jgi:2-polyprenyl-3-methyl-5-hydroxy-6-metoxy-1,4-benzoquinol methylase